MMLVLVVGLVLMLVAWLALVPNALRRHQAGLNRAVDELVSALHAEDEATVELSDSVDDYRATLEVLTRGFGGELPSRGPRGGEPETFEEVVAEVATETARRWDARSARPELCGRWARTAFAEPVAAPQYLRSALFADRAVLHMLQPPAEWSFANIVLFGRNSRGALEIVPGFEKQLDPCFEHYADLAGAFFAKESRVER